MHQFRTAVKEEKKIIIKTKIKGLARCEARDVCLLISLMAKKAENNEVDKANNNART